MERSTFGRRALRRVCTAAAPGQRSNWCENVPLAHRAFAAPESVPELQDMTRDASRLRVLGSGHSFSSLCRSEDTLVSLAFMRNILEIEVRSETDCIVHVEGGATLGDVVRHLAPRGFALRNIPSLPHVTVAGALATATHGSGLQSGAEGGLPSMCQAIEFVAADGELVAYERGRDAEFAAAVVHLGALGPVSRVALACVPAFEVVQHVYGGVDLDEMLPRFEELARSVDSLTVGANLGAGGGRGAGMLWMRYFDRADGRGTPPPPAPPPTLLGGALRHEPVPFYESQLGVPATRTGPWHDVPSFFMDGMRDVNMPRVACQSEYFVPLGRAAEALHAAREVARRWPGWPASEAWADMNREVPVFHCELRAIPRDQLSGMSPFAARDSCSIHFTWGGWEHAPRIRHMVAELEAAIKPFGALPHLGKLNFFSSAELRAAYPAGAVDEFTALARSHDPNGKFFNALLRAQLLGEGEAHEEYAF